MFRINTIELHSGALDLGAARIYLRAIGRMADEGARSTNPAVVLLALKLLEHEAPRAARALTRRLN